MKKLWAACAAAIVPVALLVGPAGAEDGPPTRVSPVALSAGPVAGSTVTARPAAWTEAPDRRTYEWLRDGEGDVLGRDASYTAAPADLGHTLVVVERVWFGSREDDSSSTPVAVAAPAPAVAEAPVAQPIVAARNTKRPTTKGTPKVGRTLKVRSKGSWVAPGHSFRYQWLRSGKAIKKATKSSYRLTRSDRKKKVTVRVYAVRPGFPTVAATSRTSKRVR